MVLIVPDVHYPVHDWRAVSVLEAAAADLGPDAIVQLGDYLELGALGRFTTQQDSEGQRLVADARLGGKGLAKLLGAARKKNPGCRLWVLQGNHEQRVERLYGDVPYLDGLFSVPGVLGLVELGAEWVPADGGKMVLRFDWTPRGIRPRVYRRQDWFGSPGIAFCHGWDLNEHHAKKHALAFPWGPLFYGHSHQMQSFRPKSFGCPPPFAMSCGHLRLADPEWVKGPHSWQQGFVVVTMGAGPGDYSVEPVRISVTPANGRVARFRGKEYRAG